MITVDASVITDFLTMADERGMKARAAVGRDPAWTAPDHLKIEVVSAIRGRVIGGKVREDKGRSAVGRVPELNVDYVSVDRLLTRVWQLRDNFSAYDAAYVALAEARKLTLVTADARLARAALPYCTVELVK